MLFLLRYIDDVEVRKIIHAATNKSEEFNGFVKWAFFGGEGIIAENVQHEQRKIVRYNQLVANLVILHNVEQRSEEHTSELQSLMRISYAVFCLKKKNTKHRHTVVTVNKAFKVTKKTPIEQRNTEYTYTAITHTHNKNKR